MSTFDSVLHITFPKRGNCAALVSSSVNPPAGAVGAQTYGEHLGEPLGEPLVQ